MVHVPHTVPGHEAGDGGSINGSPSRIQISVA